MKLEVKKLNLKYPSGEKALSDVSLETDGVIAVVGAEKSGKTSLLRCIAGLESFSGEVLLSGEKLQNIPAECRDIQLFFENFSVFENKTVFSNLAYPLKIRGEKFSEIKPKVDSVALDFGLYDVLEFKAKRLTEDQKRTVALARLFLRDAKFTLLDDPTAGFSKKASGEVFSRMKKAALKKSGVVVYATQNIGEAFEIANEAVFLNFGQVKQTGSMEDMYYRPNFVVVAEAFGDYNKVEATLCADGGKLFVTLFGKNITLANTPEDLLSEDYIGKKVIVGFRYSGVKIVSSSATENGGNTYRFSEFSSKSGKYIGKIETELGDVFVETDEKFGGEFTLSVESAGINLFDVLSEGSLTIS